MFRSARWSWLGHAAGMMALLATATCLLTGCAGGGVTFTHGAIFVRSDWITLVEATGDEPVAVVQQPHARWEVLKVEVSRSDQITSSSDYDRTALRTEGKFLCVEYRVKNEGIEPRHVDFDCMYCLRDPTSRRVWSPHSKSWKYVPRDGLNEKVQPGLRLRRWILFELPRDIRELEIGFCDLDELDFDCEKEYADLHLTEAVEKLRQDKAAKR